MLEEHDAQDTLNTRYVYGHDLLSQHRTTTTSCYHTDGLHSTRLLSDVSGTITDTYAYDAYGLLLESTGSTRNPYRYRGEQYDPELSAYYLRARYYQPGIGRFVTVDPLEGTVYDPYSLQRYMHTHDNPVNYIDPSGKGRLKELAIASAIVLSLAAYQIFGEPIRRLIFDDNRREERRREGLKNIEKHEHAFQHAADDHNMDVGILKAIYLNEYMYAKKGSTGTGLRESV